MQLIVIGSFLLTMIFPLVTSGILLQIEQQNFEQRIKHADTILFGRFNWVLPMNDNNDYNQVHASRQTIYEFIVYCTIKKSKVPENVSHFIRIIIKDNGN